MQHNITDLLDLAVYNPAELTAEQLNTEFTLEEKLFVVQFLADTLHGLATCNTEVFAEEQDFARITDCVEVAEHYVALMSTAQYADADTPATFTFTIEDAGAALCSYDTEYRECIQEQFTYACVEQAYKYSTNKANFLHLPARCFNAY